MATTWTLCRSLPQSMTFLIMTRFALLLLLGAEHSEAHEYALDGSGTTNPSRFYWQVMSRLEARAKPAVLLTYRAVGSSTGIYEFMGADQNYVAYNDFGSGDVPISAEDYQTLTSGQGIDILHVPFSLGAMSFFHNVPGAVGGLNMTACVLADIFKRNITVWDHPDILALNPNLEAPTNENILVYRRVEGSSTTAGITTYLNAACPSKWGPELVGTQIEWPEDTNGAQGSGGMSAAISSNQYSIGYIDSGHGHDNFLFEIELENRNGTLLDSLRAKELGGIQAAAAEALALGIMPNDPAADFSGVSLHNMPGQYTWPIVAISYIFIRQDQRNETHGALLKAFVDYVISDEGQTLLRDYNFEPVPSTVLAVAQSASSAIELPPDHKVWQFESAETTQRGVGQEDYVMSGKRRSYYEYAISELETNSASMSDLQALEARINSLDARLSLGQPDDVHEYALDGSGTTNPSRFYWQVMSRLEARAKPAVSLTYRAVGSSTGIYEFMGAAQNYVAYNDFGSGDVPISAADYEELTSGQGIDILHVPFSLGAMSFFHNVPGAVGGLNMTACVLADIFKRDITVWDHPDILALNPNLDVPANENILVFHRVEGSSTTAGITTYLNAACPSKWGPELVGTQIEWPEDTYGAQGSGGMSAAIASNQYSIGYIDSGHGHDNFLFEIELENRNGTLLDSLRAKELGGIQAAAAEALALGIMPNDPAADFSGVSLHNMPGQYTWPIVAISYIFIRQDQRNQTHGALLKAFVDYVISDEGQTLLQDYNFERVPNTVLAVAQSASAAIELAPDHPVWQFESVDSTQRGDGQEDFVISGKRRSYYEYAISELETNSATMSDLKALQARMDNLDARTDSLDARTDRLARMPLGQQGDVREYALDGSGTTNPSRFYWQVMSRLEARAKPAVSLTYRAVGSSTGIYEFMGADQNYVAYNDFGSGDVPISAADYEELTSGQGIDILHVPFSLGAMSFFHNVPGAVGGLNMTACVLADIFKRDITVWDHPDILALNPNLDVPANENILVFHRVEGSSTTAGITTYLNAACPSKWGPELVGTQIEWPEDTYGAQGSGGMSAAIASHQYSIGYIDSGHGHDNFLFEIELENRDGTLLDSLRAKELGGIQAAAAEALALGIMPNDPAADFSGVSLHNMPGQYTWPIVAISYIFIRQDQRNQTHGALLKAFVDYVISDEGQTLLQDYNFEPVPVTVLAVAESASAAIELAPDQPVWKFESAETTQRGAGQEDYVMSGKRRSYYEYSLNELETNSATMSDLQALQARIDVLTSLQGSSIACDCSDDDDNSNRGRNIAIALSIISLVIAILACLLAASAYVKAKRALEASGVRANEMTNIDCVPCGKPNKEDAYGDLGKQEEHNEI